MQELGNQNTWGSTLNPNRNSNVCDNQGQLSSQNETTSKTDNHLIKPQDKWHFCRQTHKKDNNSQNGLYGLTLIIKPKHSETTRSNFNHSSDVTYVSRIGLMESGILGFGIGIQLKESGIPLTIGIQNPSSTDKYWNPVPGIRNPWRWIQNPRLSWIPVTWGDL